MARPTRGVLVEYAISIPPMALVFEFNPETITRNRSITVTAGSAPGTLGGFDFLTPFDTPRVSQGVSMAPETFSIDILLDATDRMNDGDNTAAKYGVQPELDTLRTMVEPKVQGPGGVQLLADLGLGGQRAFQRRLTASVLLFIWGSHVLPVFLTSINVQERSHLPSLQPYRANVRLDMQVIEGANPFYQVEKLRQVISAARNTGRLAAEALGAIF